MNKPHKHAALIKAWADGAEIQTRYQDSLQRLTPWLDVQCPAWMLENEYEYRVKPLPKPDVVGYIQAQMPTGKMSVADADEAGLLSWCTLTRTGIDNIKCTFDGETGKLKSVEVLA